MMDPVFLKLDEVLALHREQIELYGGSAGVRDMNLLLSALAMPAATFGDAFLHGTLHEMAAASRFTCRRTIPLSTATSGLR